MDLYKNAVEKNKSEFFDYVDNICKEFDAVCYNEDGSITLNIG